MLSGIGRAEDLREHGVDVGSTSRRSARTCSDHVNAGIILRTDGRVARGRAETTANVALLRARAAGR